MFLEQMGKLSSRDIYADSENSIGNGIHGSGVGTKNILFR